MAESKKSKEEIRIEDSYSKEMQALEEFYNVKKKELVSKKESDLKKLITNKKLEESKQKKRDAIVASIKELDNLVELFIKEYNEFPLIEDFVINKERYYNSNLGKNDLVSLWLRSFFN